MSQKNNEKTEAEMTDLEYLRHSKLFLEDVQEKSLERVRTIQEEIKELQENITNITSEKLRKAATSVHNQLAIERRQLLDQIKRARVDLAHVTSIHKKLRDKGKK